MKRRVNRHNRRLKERQFREKIENAFEFRGVQIVPVEELKLKVDEETFQKIGKLSSFPVNFFD